MNDIDDDWEKFLLGDDGIESRENINIENSNFDKDKNNVSDIPKASELYISTKTKIIYVDKDIDLNKIFWLLPVIDYGNATEGIIKKQMKFNSVDPSELELINNEKKKYKYVNENIIYNSSNLNLRDCKFKDVRKISIGISKKDIISYRSKQKSAFYNCFVVNLRIFHNNVFREIHVKVFNTGKMEIPGIQCENLFKIIKTKILLMLQPYFEETICFQNDKEQTVLVNSNFQCGFYLDREKLFNLLKYKYNIQANYDPCSYPGIQCKYTIRDSYVSFMIFRTGSVLIVGKCLDEELKNIYEYLKNLLSEEYQNISINFVADIPKVNKPKKVRKKIIYFNSDSDNSSNKKS